MLRKGIVDRRRGGGNETIPNMHSTAVQSGSPTLRRATNGIIKHKLQFHPAPTRLGTSADICTRRTRRPGAPRTTVFSVYEGKRALRVLQRFRIFALAMGAVGWDGKVEKSLEFKEATIRLSVEQCVGG